MGTGFAGLADFAGFVQKNVRRPACKPGSVPRREASDGHFSSRPVARPIEQPTRESITDRTGPAPLFGLAPGGVCRASLSPGCWWALTLRDRSPPTFSPLPGAMGSVRRSRRYTFCCTFPVLQRSEGSASDGGRYPPPRPAEPGLSSPRLREQRPPSWPANLVIVALPPNMVQSEVMFSIRRPFQAVHAEMDSLGRPSYIQHLNHTAVKQFTHFSQKAPAGPLDSPCRSL